MSEITVLRKGDILRCVNIDTPDWWEFECCCETDSDRDNCEGTCNEYEAPYEDEEYEVTHDWNRDLDSRFVSVKRVGRRWSEEFDIDHFELVLRRGAPYLSNQGTEANY